MAKRFGGFTPQQQQTLLSKMGYTGPAQQDDINKFMMSSPKAASMMGRYTQLAKARVEGGPQMAMQAGGMTEQEKAANAAMTNLPENASQPSMDPTQGTGFGGAGLPPAQNQILSYQQDIADFNSSDVITAANKAQEQIKQDAYKQLGITGQPTQEQAGQLDVIMQEATANSPEIQAAIKAQEEQNAKMQEQYGQGEATQPDPAEQYRTSLDQAQENVVSQNQTLQELTNQLANMAVDEDNADLVQQRKDLEDAIAKQQTIVTQAKAQLSGAEDALKTAGLPSATEVKEKAITTPEDMVTKADVVTVTDEQRKAGKVADGTGLPPEEVAEIDLTLAELADKVELPERFTAAGMTVEEAANEVKTVVDKVTAATGKPSAEALAEAASMDPNDLAQLGLSAAQIEAAVQVIAPEKRELVEGELIEGATVDMERVRKETNFEAATGVPSTDATVQGQLTGLLEQFEGGETPPWAAGAMRQATAALAARGLGASSMAGQAVIQAAMESALPIAQADAATRARFEEQNLSNRQQAAMFAAEKRAEFLGIEFDQEFQTRVANAAKISDIANTNFTAEQTIALENARLAQSVDIANLDAKNAKVLADAAAMTQIETQNLDNRQKANVQRANAFLEMDMSNLDREQEATIFKSKSLADVYTSDAAAKNAGNQFNASSEDQTNQFFADLDTGIAKHNTVQENSINMSNAGEANAVNTYIAGQKNNREEFIANHELIVAQGNAVWEQAITTTDNAAQNEANKIAAQEANDLSDTAYNAILMEERDKADYVFRAYESEQDRTNAYAIAEMQTQANIDVAAGEGAGKIVETVVELAAKKVLGLG
jgi:hypothetical protein